MQVLAGTPEFLKKLADGVPRSTRVVDVFLGETVRHAGQWATCAACLKTFRKADAWLDDDGLFCPDCGRERFFSAFRSLRSGGRGR